MEISKIYLANIVEVCVLLWSQKTQLNKMANEQLTKLKTKLEFYQKLDVKLERIANGELLLDNYRNEVSSKMRQLEHELSEIRTLQRLLSHHRPKNPEIEGDMS